MGFRRKSQTCGIDNGLSYCNEARTSEHGLQWSTGSRLIGLEKDINSLSETEPRTCSIICDSVSVPVAVDHLCPCTSAELLTFHCTQTRSSSPLATDAWRQQGSIDERAPIKPTATDSSRNANEEEDEDERDDEMSDSTQIARTEKRKELQTDETAKELWALIPVTDSSHASSLRLSYETQEQLERSSKQARIARKGVERPQEREWLECARATRRR